MLFLTSCLSFSLSSCKRRNGRARAHAIRTCRYSNMFEKQNSLYRLKKGAECEYHARGVPHIPAPREVHQAAHKHSCREEIPVCPARPCLLLSFILVT